MYKYLWWYALAKIYKLLYQTFFSLHSRLNQVSAQSWCLNFLAWTCQNGLQIIAQTFGHFRSSKMEKNALRRLNSICCLDRNTLWKNQKFCSLNFFPQYVGILIWNLFTFNTTNSALTPIVRKNMTLSSRFS